MDDMTYGYVRHDWYTKYPGGQPFLAARFSARCTDAGGCIEVGYYTPTYPYVVTSLNSYGIPPDPAWVTPLACWCSNGVSLCSFI